MTVQQILDLSLANTHTITGQVSAANLLAFFNMVRKDLGNTIISSVNENFFYEIWERDAINDQTNGEYPYPEADEDSNGMLKCSSLFVKPYRTDDYFVRATEVDIRALEKDWNYYLDNQPKSDPIYYIGDNSFFIAPQFEVTDLTDPSSEDGDISGNQQIKAMGTVKFIDLTAGSADTTVLIPDDFQHLIALGMEQYIYKNRGNRDESSLSAQEYRYAKEEMIDLLTNRDDSKMIAKLPDETNNSYGE